MKLSIVVSSRDILYYIGQSLTYLNFDLSNTLYQLIDFFILALLESRFVDIYVMVSMPTRSFNNIDLFFYRSTRWCFIS